MESFHHLAPKKKIKNCKLQIHTDYAINEENERGVNEAAQDQRRAKRMRG